MIQIILRISIFALLSPAALAFGAEAGIGDPAVAEDGYQDHLLTLNRKPYPSTDGLRNAQRLMAQQNPKIAAHKVEGLVDRRFVRKLDESGFIDRLYGASH
jgi:hypothetical protein